MKAKQRFYNNSKKKKNLPAKLLVLILKNESSFGIQRFLKKLLIQLNYIDSELNHDESAAQRSDNEANQKQKHFQEDFVALSHRFEAIF